MDSAALERAYRTFVHCHHVVNTAPTEEALLREVCRTAVEDLGFRLAWIGLVDGDDPRVRPVAQAGYEEGYLESIVITRTEGEHGFGPTGSAIRDGRAYVSRDIATDPRFEPWRAEALRRGYASSAAIPLCDGTRCFGALNLYATEPDAFDDEEIALLEDVAVDLVLGVIRLRSAHRHDDLSEIAERAARAEIAGTVAAAVAHDINNLLQIVTVSIEGARRLLDPVRRERCLDDAAHATASAAMNMQHLLALTRRAVESPDVVDPDSVLLKLRSLVARLAPRCSLEIAPGAAYVSVRVASLDLERIVINLVVNAAQAMPEGGPIHLATTPIAVGPGGRRTATETLREGRYVALEVADAGPGIPPEVLPRIFQPFFTTKGDSGTGLGLPSILQIVRAAEGAVDVSSAPGRGTRFAVYLPVAASATRTKSSPPR